MNRILALDWWSRRIGVARVDMLNKTPLPLGYIENTSMAYINVTSLAVQYRITTLVYGYPQGNEAVGQKIDKFISALKFSLDPETKFFPVDEHYSSVQAGEITGDIDHKHISQDTVSAMVILERYLSSLEALE